MLIFIFIGKQILYPINRFTQIRKTSIDSVEYNNISITSPSWKIQCKNQVYKL